MSDTRESSGKSAEKSGGTLASVLNVVPVIYYDLIARICPGMAFWIALFLNERTQVTLKVLGSDLGESLFLLIVLSYLSGIVLTGFSIAWDYVSLWLFSPFKVLMSALGLRPGIPLPKQWERVAQKMEAIGKKNDDAGRIVAKALAEVALCQNLLTGLVVLTAIGCMSGGRFFFEPTKYGLYLSLLALLFLVAALFRQAMFLGRVQALYQMYVDPKG